MLGERAKKGTWVGIRIRCSTEVAILVPGAFILGILLAWGHLVRVGAQCLAMLEGLKDPFTLSSSRAPAAQH